MMDTMENALSLARRVLNCDGCHIAVLQSIGVQTAADHGDQGAVQAAFRAVRNLILPQSAVRKFSMY
jgi:hypothetical protein